MKQALSMNSYPQWIPTEPSSTTSVSIDDTSDDTRLIHKKPTSKKPSEVLSYIRSEQIRRVFKQYEVPAYFKPMNTIHQLLIRPKGKIMKK